MIKATQLAVLTLFAAVPLASAQTARQREQDRAPGWEVRGATARAEREPGLTRELAPDARQTATGGPSGGIPGQSGN